MKGIRRHSKKHGYISDIDRDYIQSLIVTSCPVFKTVLQYVAGAERNTTCAVLDRIDSALGYIRGNVQIISDRANTIKNNATPEELMVFAQWVINTYKAPHENSFHQHQKHM